MQHVEKRFSTEKRQIFLIHIIRRHGGARTLASRLGHKTWSTWWGWGSTAKKKANAKKLLTDGWDGRDDLAKLQLVENRCLPGGVKTDHQNSHLLLAKKALQTHRNTRRIVSNLSFHTFLSTRTKTWHTRVSNAIWHTSSCADYHSYLGWKR